jgi:pentapeptide MXKDX repeat protein
MYDHIHMNTNDHIWTHDHMNYDHMNYDHMNYDHMNYDHMNYDHMNYDHIWSHMIPYDHIWSHMITYDHIWSRDLCFRTIIVNGNLIVNGAEAINNYYQYGEGERLVFSSEIWFKCLQKNLSFQNLLTKSYKCVPKIGKLQIFLNQSICVTLGRIGTWSPWQCFSFYEKW